MSALVVALIVLAPVVALGLLVASVRIARVHERVVMFRIGRRCGLEELGENAERM